MLEEINMTGTGEESAEPPIIDPSSPTSCLYGAGPTMIDAHFTTLPKDAPSSLTIDSNAEIPKSCFPSPKSSVGSCTVDAIPAAHVERIERIEMTELSSQQNARSIDDDDRDSIARQCAKIVLRTMVRYPRETPVGQNAEWLPRGFLTQSTIKWHVSVMKEMVEISPIEITPANIVTYTCRMLEIPSISTISGRQFRCMELSDKVDVVLAIARQFADLYWQEHDDGTYEACHRLLDQQAWHYVNITYPDGDAFCCSVM